MAEFLYEIGFEEMPARFLPKLEWDFSSLLSKSLLDANIEFTEPKVCSTPRRLVVFIDAMEPLQRDVEEVVMGPPMRIAYDAENKPTKAAAGFAKTQEVDLSETFAVDTEKGAYLAVRKRTGGASTLSLLPDICAGVAAALPFPKKMRWGERDFAFGRPIHWFLALFGNDEVSFELAGVRSGTVTWGHRVHGPGPWTVRCPSEYASLLAAQAQVVLDAEERKKVIVEEGDAQARELGGRTVWAQALLEEVSCLVEFPKPLLGAFDRSFLDLPRQVLLTSMETHQKSFGVEDAEGNLLPYFVCTLNLEPKNLDVVRRGWERVLKARLEDARFFWRTDLETPLDQWLAALDSVVFLGPLGSMGDKSRRLERLCAWLAPYVSPELISESARAGRIAKADLVSEMVGEFADLQGVMGGIYASRKGEAAAVAQAVSEQYLPAGPDTPIPGTPLGCIVSLADKADSLAGCFGLNMIPTGAADPYALRRAALGICRIVMEAGIRLPLGAFFQAAIEGYGDVRWKLDPQETLGKLSEFVAGRMKSLLASLGFETLLIEAVLGAGADDLWATRARLEALALASQEQGFAQSMLTFKRAANIIRKQGSESGVALTGCYDRALFQEQPERDLADAVERLEPRFESLWEKDLYAALLGVLRELRPHVDAFFDGVMVMSDDTAVRKNRLNLLQRLVGLLGRLADFNALQM